MTRPARSMERVVAGLAVAAALLSPLRGDAQLANADTLASGLPASLALPVGGAASAEEPSALGVNPAGIGFVRDACLQWFHQEKVVGRSAADGLYLAGAIGPVGGGFGMEWVRPQVGYGARYRKTTLALAFTDQKEWSLAIGWNWLASPDAARDLFRSVDLGLTLRPWRHFSAGAAALGMQARLGGERLPVRYVFGLATRFVDDTFTLSADLIADDRSRDDFAVTHASFGLGMETRFGLGLGVQLQLPIMGGEDPSAIVTLTWNGAHGGYTGGVVTRGGSTGWLTGVRASSERYRGVTFGGEVPSIELARELKGDGSFLAVLSDRNPWLDLVRKLEQVRDDPGAEGLVVRIGALDLGRARIEELRARISEIASRKPVLAYLTGGGTKEYLLAAGATAVAVAPGATLFFSGVGTEQLYLRDALARAGIAVDVVKVGAWKSAPEPLTRAEGSGEARGAIEALLDDVHARDVGYVSIIRGLSTDRVEALFDRALFSAVEARAAGLVDEVLWPDELEGWARRRISDGIDLSDSYDLEEERGALRWGQPPAIGVVLLEGTIVPGRTRREALGTALAGADTVTAALKRAAEDSTIKAVVLRIDSGGGDGLASDLIWREVQRTRKRKPVVVSMGDMAASGGYLAAVGADAIVAEPSTLTGSIGVFAMKPDLSGLLEKLGVRREPHQRGDKALVTSVAKPWTEAERAAMQGQVDAFYARFVDRVAEGRKLARADAEKVAQGRVWTGQQALARALVDRLGTLSDAIDLAREKAGLAKDAELAIRRVDAPRGLAQILRAAGSALAPDAGAARLMELVGGGIPELRALGALAELGPIVALPPLPLESDP
ncbi:MAG TPA: signal peptide peptidase SppA [Anaeromyxobacteraceae bacterium]|nr:signal peptide peptidase SppA [Anaeromyxobacteraceae bacterium]